VTPRWIDDPADFADVLAALAAEPVFAMDTEFHRERSYFPHVALVQLAWPGTIAIVDPLAVDLGPLAEVLAGPAVVVMHAAAQDLEVLDRACGQLPAHLFDTQLAAGFVGYGSPSLATLVEREVGVRLPKGDRLTDWLRRPLSADQRTYAAADVEHLLPLHEQLVTRLERSGRLAWALDECEDLRRRGLVRRDPSEAWWRIKEARQLRWPAVGVAQAVAAWRELRAMETDQPARFVLPDLALVGIAQRPPANATELRRVRGLDERHLRGDGAAAILAAVQAARSMPRAELRVPPASDIERELRPAVALVSAWVSQLGRDLQIDSSLLATRSDLEALLRGDDGGRLTRGWRADALGDAVRALVAGKASLAFNGKGSLVLEQRSGQKPTGS
jgi:ribonuclease D